MHEITDLLEWREGGGTGDLELSRRGHQPDHQGAERRPDLGPVQDPVPHVRALQQLRGGGEEGAEREVDGRLDDGAVEDVRPFAISSDGGDSDSPFRLIQLPD